MKRRDFFKLTAVNAIISAFPTIAFSQNHIYIRPSGGDDTDTINMALKASARIGEPAIITKGVFTIKNTITVPIGAKLISQGMSSLISYTGNNANSVIIIQKPCTSNSVKNLYVKDHRSIVSMIALIG